MKYRIDIDGLRAIAVIAVVAFHVGLPGWQGGFAGVDIFFVISGFLISTLLLDEFSRNGRISFVDFYARRMRRILPAMSVVVGATVLAAAFLLNPLEQQKSTMQGAVASTLFFANIFFWRTTGGYFDDNAETMPLLHMWSLGVEEQWYLVFPFLLVCLLTWLSRSGKTTGVDRSRALLLVFALLLLASFLLCVIGTAYRPRAAFFLLPTRAWEFLAGVCTAIVLRRGYEPTVQQAQVLSLLGFAGLVLTVVLLEEGHGFPGAVAALPVASTSLLIVGGQQQHTLTHRVLSLSALRWVGRVSYSWYLWHWPLLTFARMINYGEANLVVDVLFGAVLSLGLAALTYRYVEQPARHPRANGLLDGSGRPLLAGGMLMSALIAASLAGWAYASKVERQPEYLELVEAIRSNRESEYGKCMGKFVNGIPEQFSRSGCVFGDGDVEPAIVLWGDSHGNHFSALLDALAPDDDVSFLLRALGNCAPVNGIILGTPGHKDSVCADFVRAVYEEIESGALHNLQAVVLVGRWASVLGKQIDTPPEMARGLLTDDGVPLRREAALALVETQLNTLAEMLGKRDIRLLLVFPSPEMPHSVPQCLARRVIDECTVSRAQVEIYSADIRTMFARLESKHSNVRYWDPLPYICDATICPAARDGITLYSDDNHVSGSGALSLEEPFRREAWHWLLKPHGGQ